MSFIEVCLVGLFLPLFPLSIGFNFLLGQIKHPILKILLLVLWPLLGLVLFLQFDVESPSWVIGWVAFTSMLYAYRLLTQRDINTWVGFLATSAWCLLWIPLLLSEVNVKILVFYALAFTIPLAMILFMANELKQRFGIAYTHLYGGLAATMPRFSGILIVIIFASIATPVFPGFFIMLSFITAAISMDFYLIAIILLLTWLLWSWAGIRVIQGLLIGPADQQQKVEDLQSGRIWSFVLILIALVVYGSFISGDLL